jgi:hypothetical protein
MRIRWTKTGVDEDEDEDEEGEGEDEDGEMTVVDGQGWDGDGDEELPTPVPWCSELLAPHTPPVLSLSVDVALALGAAPMYDEEPQTPVPGLYTSYSREATPASEGKRTQ